VEDARNYYITVLAMVMPKVRVEIVEDPEDNRVLECALEARADFIATGNKHLLEIHGYRGVRIVRASEFLEAFESNLAS